MQAKRKIIVAPLHWGLGHASRCVPIIRLLLENNFEVLVASDGDALALLQLEFPSLSFFSLPSYNIRYDDAFARSMAKQLPAILFAIEKERRAIAKIATETGAEIILSDNRYGCHSPFTKNIFICHQHHLLVPFFEKQVNFLHQQFLKKFDEHWIPDSANRTQSLAGKLSETVFPNARYVGRLSRFEKMKVDIIYDCIGVVSGPEPGRTAFEIMLKKQFAESPLQTLLVCGNMNKEPNEEQVGNCTVKNFLATRELNLAICQSKVVLCRSGYSSVMDLSALEKKAIFVPSAGQTEQEYLAGYFQQKKIAPFFPQADFDLQKALAQLPAYTGFTNHQSQNDLRSAIQTL